MYVHHAALWLELLSCLGTSVLISLLELLCFKDCKAGVLFGPKVVDCYMSVVYKQSTTQADQGACQNLHIFRNLSELGRKLEMEIGRPSGSGK